MPFALIVVGLVLMSAGVRNKQTDLFNLVKNDFTGKGNFFYWAVSIFAIGTVGYVQKLKPISDAFLALVIIVLFLHNNGFFSQFNRALQVTDTPAPKSQQPQSQLQAADGALSTGALGDFVGQLGKYADQLDRQFGTGLDSTNLSNIPVYGGI